MCDVLQIEKSTFYYEAKDRQSEEQLTEAIVDIFQKIDEFMALGK